MPFAQINWESLQRQGAPAAIIAGLVGSHVPAAISIHGWGVNTPNAAAVAEATCGFAIDVHMPKDDTLLFACISLIVAIGFPSARHCC